MPQACPTGFTDAGTATGPTAAVRRRSIRPSGTNPNNRNCNRNTQTKRAENRQNEFGEQAYMVSYAR
jgi:hypothetical protein